MNQNCNKNKTSQCHCCKNQTYRPAVPESCLCHKPAAQNCCCKCADKNNNCTCNVDGGVF